MISPSWRGRPGGARIEAEEAKGRYDDRGRPARFAHVTDWVFDLDNTLYPHHSNLFSQIDVKMTAYVSELLHLPREEARKLQKELYLEYGTTLNGLMQRHGIDPDDFLEKVHDIDYSWLMPDPVLGAAIRQLPGRKFIFTNGNRGHAETHGAAARHPRRISTTSSTSSRPG